jgi:hypothetical protein
MGTYAIEHIIKEWSKDNMTSEQVIGQVLLLLQEIKERIAELETRLFRLENTASK